MKFEVKCDECKKTIGHTDNMIDSVAGGKCVSCRQKSLKENKVWDF